LPARSVVYVTGSIGALDHGRVRSESDLFDSTKLTCL
jgi:hypothetical protein